MTNIKLNVNGKAVVANVEDRTLLVDFIREHLKLTGTHVGCDTSQCGACLVLFNGSAIKSCSVLTVQANDAKIITIEGISANGALHPVQAAFKEKHGLQCGFCTPGMIIAAVDMIERIGASNLDEEKIREELDGNICRCTGYNNIVKSIEAAAREMA